MRLIHYSKTPLIMVRSRKHSEDGAGAYKTPGLWVSVEGEDDWLAWCRSEGWGLDRMVCAAEVILSPASNVKRLTSAYEIDEFSDDFRTSGSPIWHRGLDWSAIRDRWQGLIIAPYCWERRLADHTGWYYGWDCASGVIWDAAAVESVQSIAPPDLTEQAA